MTTREALAALASDGVRLTVWELRGKIERGEVSRPRMSTALQWDWTLADLERVKAAALRERETVAQ